jgi:hypothetical protein
MELAIQQDKSLAPQLSLPCPKQSNFPSLKLVSKSQDRELSEEHIKALADIALVRAGKMQMKVLAAKYRGAYNTHRNCKSRAKNFNVSLDQRFVTFPDFLEAMGPPPNVGDTLDRINSKGPYELHNVRWADKTIQARNRSNVQFLSIEGVRRPLVEVAEILNVSAACLRSRRKNGWSDQEIVCGARSAKQAGVTKPVLNELSRLANALPWPQEDLERWEEKYQSSGCRTSRLQYAHEESTAQLRMISREIENLSHSEDFRDEQTVKYETNLARRQAFYSRAFCKVQRIARAGIASKFDLPDSVNRRLTGLFAISMKL